MKIKRTRIMVFVLLALGGFAAVPEACASSAWADDDYRSSHRDRSGFWGRGSSGSGRYPTTAEISQALYGTDPDQYDTAGSVNDAPEAVTQTG